MVGFQLIFSIIVEFNERNLFQECANIVIEMAKMNWKVLFLVLAILKEAHSGPIMTYVCFTACTAGNFITQKKRNCVKKVNNNFFLIKAVASCYSAAGAVFAVTPGLIICLLSQGIAT